MANPSLPQLPTLSHDRLLLMLDYNPETGWFTWRRQIGNRKAGDRAGGAPDPKREYRVVSIDGVRYYEHRLAWFYMTRRWPVREIDHKNRREGDNWFDNLREANRSQNTANRDRKGAAGFKGVSLDRRRGTWCVDVSNTRKRIRKSGFATAEAAYAVYVDLARELHGEFARAT